MCWQGSSLKVPHYRWVPLKVDFLGAGNSVWLKHYLAYPVIIISLIMQRNLAKKIWAKQESGLTAVQLKRDPPVFPTFFWSGVIVVIFHQLRKQACDIEQLIIIVISGANILICLFTILDGIGCNTHDIAFDFLTNPSTSSTVTSVNLDKSWPLLKSAVGSYKGKFARWSLIVTIFYLKKSINLFATTLSSSPSVI